MIVEYDIGNGRARAEVVRETNKNVFVYNRGTDRIMPAKARNPEQYKNAMRMRGWFGHVLGISTRPKRGRAERVVKAQQKLIRRHKVKHNVTIVKEV